MASNEKPIDQSVRDDMARQHTQDQITSFFGRDSVALAAVVIAVAVVVAVILRVVGEI